MNNRDKTVELMELRFEKKLESEISGLRREMDAGFMSIQKQFTEMQKQFGNQALSMEGKITKQTKWLVTVISFLAVLMKTVDLLAG